MRIVKRETTEARWVGRKSRDYIKGVRVVEIGKPNNGRMIPVFLLDIYTSTKHKDYKCVCGHAQDLTYLSWERDFWTDWCSWHKRAMSLQLLGKSLSEKMAFHPGKLFFISKRWLHPSNVYSYDLSLTPETWGERRGLLSWLGSSGLHSKTPPSCLPLDPGLGFKECRARWK